MSRAAGGTYTLPAGNPVVTGTTISSTWGNTTLTDIATALTDSLSRSGLGGMTAPLLGVDGTAALPAHSFTNEPSSGLYRISAGLLGLSVLNRLTWSVSSNGNMIVASPVSGVTLTLAGPGTGQELVLNTAANWGGIAFQLAGVSKWSLLHDFDAAGEFALYNNTAGASSLRVTSAGAYSIISPSAGVPLTINNTTASTIVATLTSTQSQAAASPTLKLTSTAAGGFSTLSICSNSGTSGTNDFAFFQNGSTSDATILNRANAILNLGTNGTVRFIMAATGNMSTVAPTTGVSLTVNGVSGTHSTQIADSAAAVFNAGFLELPINTQNTAYQTVLADAGKAIYHSDGTARTYTIPANATVAYPIGTTLTFVNDASGAVNVTISITTDTLQLAPGGTTGSRTLAQFGRATAHKVAATKWIISGVGLT